MKIRCYSPEKDGEKTIWIPTGFLFTRVGMYFAAKLASAQARKAYDQAVEQMWKASNEQENPLDELLTMEEMQVAEKLQPPITEAQARELFTALRDSRYLMHGLPLMSLEHPDGTRVRVDL